jgi:hypothetical protein
LVHGTATLSIMALILTTKTQRIATLDVECPLLCYSHDAATFFKML